MRGTRHANVTGHCFVALCYCCTGTAELRIFYSVFPNSQKLLMWIYMQEHSFIDD